MDWAIRLCRRVLLGLTASPSRKMPKGVLPSFLTGLGVLRTRDHAASYAQPRASIPNIANGLPANIELAAKRKHALVISQPLDDLAHLRLGKLGLPIFLAVAVPPLREFVRHVVGLRSEKQMAWAYAARVVASVKDVKSWWNWSVRFYPGNAMSPVHAAFKPH